MTDTTLALVEIVEEIKRTKQGIDTSIASFCNSDFIFVGSNVNPFPQPYKNESEFNKDVTSKWDSIKGQISYLLNLQRALIIGNVCPTLYQNSISNPDNELFKDMMTVDDQLYLMAEILALRGTRDNNGLIVVYDNLVTSLTNAVNRKKALYNNSMQAYERELSNKNAITQSLDELTLAKVKENQELTKPVLKDPLNFVNDRLQKVVSKVEDFKSALHIKVQIHNASKLVPVKVQQAGIKLP